LNLELILGGMQLFFAELVILEFSKLANGELKELRSVRRLPLYLDAKEPRV